MTKSFVCAAALAALTWTALSWAQTVYKSTMPDGRIIYGTEPVHGAKRVETLKPAESTGVNPVGPTDAQKLQQNERQRESKEARREELQQAGLRVVRSWTDSAGDFALTLSRAD